jgi:hypothetical protein
VYDPERALACRASRSHTSGSFAGNALGSDDEPLVGVDVADELNLGLSTGAVPRTTLRSAPPSRLPGSRCGYPAFSQDADLGDVEDEHPTSTRR